MNPLRVTDLDETELLSRIFPILPASDARILGPGDDAAVLAAPDGRVVVSCDVLVDGRHFRRDWSTGVDVGARAAAQNLADIAAMGARPTALVVALVLPGSTEVAWVEDLARGLAQVCAPFGVGVEGGDLSGGEEVAVAVTVLGDLDGRAPVTRAGARPGHVLAHAGALGLSAAGLRLLSGGAGPRGELDVGTTGAEAVRGFLRPEPPIGLGPVAARAGASAMLDVSDGLVRDAGRLARASGVVVDLDRGALSGAVSRLEGLGTQLEVDPWEWVLDGGEDHGLLATFPTPEEVPTGFAVIGSVRAARNGERSGGEVLLGGSRLRGGGGWDHFGRP